MHSIRNEAFAASRPLAVLVSYVRTLRPDPHLLHLVSSLLDAQCNVALILNADRRLFGRFWRMSSLKSPTVGLQIFQRANLGYDFSAWSDYWASDDLCRSAPLLLWLNDSVLGPVTQKSLQQALASVERSDAQLVGLTESHEYCWHLQSYFLAFKPLLLSCPAFDVWVRNIRQLESKHAVVQAYELRLSSFVADQLGFRVEALFPNHTAINQTLFAWRELLRRGFPFLKRSVARGCLSEDPGRLALSSRGWKQALILAGYPSHLLSGGRWGRWLDRGGSCGA